MMADERRSLGISQSVVAKRMGTSQPFVSRFEHALLDPQMSTEDRYAAAIGRQVARTLVPWGPRQGGLEEAAPGSGARGVNLAGVPRAAAIEREVCRLGLPIRTAPVDVVRPG